MNIVAVTCVKNEGPFLLEWIAFQRLIGVTDFLFYSNDCTDGTSELLDALAREGLVTHLPNPAKGRNYQMEALKDAAKQKIVKKADWVWIADVDEFLNIHTGNHTIPDLVEVCKNPKAISVTFQFFANNGVDRFEDKPIIEQFQYSHNPDIWTDQTAIEVKTLIRKGFPLGYYGAHRPFLKKTASNIPRWTDGSGRQVQEAFVKAARKRRIRAFPAAGARVHATLNHYALRSLDSYLVKIDRGDVNREHRAFDDSYWRDRNDAAWHDPSILRHLEKLNREISAMKTLPGVADLHAFGVQTHEDMRDKILARNGMAELAQTLRQTGGIGPAEAALIARLNAA